MEEQQEQQHLFSNVRLDNTSVEHLRGIIKWSLIIVGAAVVGYVINIFQLFMTPSVQRSRPEGFEMTAVMGQNSAGSVIFSIIIGLVFNYFLYRFAVLARTALDGLDQQKLTGAFSHLKIFFIISTVVLIIVFVAMLLVTAGLISKVG